MERAVTSQGIRTINLYNLFANIVPGVYVLTGLYATVRPVPLFELAFDSEATLPVGLPLVLFTIGVAFVVGQLLQVGGGHSDDDHGFDNLMLCIRGQRESCRYRISDVERYFWELCKDQFVLSGEFESHDTLLKLTLSFVEQRGRTRALRMQALYLLARGLTVGTVVLGFFCGSLAVGLWFEYVPDGIANVLRPFEVLVAYVISSILIFAILNKNRENLEEDWIRYTVLAAYLEMSDEYRN
ncbi:hypothetical protein [Halobaculum sp. MBLA0143]|uniref:hypothetical protein n=1 Tax=Halobaculum sp. MBLA0143 TaxID=3079933 RepID=UPI0035267C8B